MMSEKKIDLIVGMLDEQGNHGAAFYVKKLDEQREYLRGVLDEIGGLCRYLRQGGADPMDLQGLEEGLSVAVDIAHDALEATK